MAWRGTGVVLTQAILLGLWCCGAAVGAEVGAEESRFALTHSRSEYVHWIDLYDATDTKIDPSDPQAPPYSPVFTCGRCHDYEAIAHGYHFNAMQKLANAGRPGEAWIWTDTRTGTQIPLSYRGWSGTYDPRELGISVWDFVLKFGRHLPGAPVDVPAPDLSARDVEGQAAATEADPSDTRSPPAVPDNGRWKLSGQLAIDCMACHSKDTAYSPETWWDQIKKQNFAWAPAAALGIADVEGDVSKLPSDFDPTARNAIQEPPQPEVKDEAKEEVKDEPKEGEGQEDRKVSGPQEGTPPEETKEASKEETSGARSEAAQDGPSLPKTKYRALRMSVDKKVFFDIVKKPSDNACYYCHTARIAGVGESPDWTHDEDVHLRAGIGCSDCHRNGIEHDTVRSFEGEKHSSKLSVATFSCRGCHLGEKEEAARVVGGRLGAPKPMHRGLPPIHLERLSCTACHSGPRPGEQALRVQTAMAHGLGLPTHELSADTEPGVVAPVMLRTDGVLYPHRSVWPAFWGEMKDVEIKPLNPEAVNEALRTTLRVRRNSTFTETLTKVTLKAEDKVAVLGEERAKVAVSELTDAEKAKLDQLEKTKAVDAFREKLGAALKALKKIVKTEGAEPVYVSGGRAYRLGTNDALEVFAHKAADPYSWKLAHDVRPARWSTGASGCYECHTLGAPIFDGQVTALGPAPDAEPPAEKMAELAGYNRVQIDAWNQSFKGRAAFKWFGFVSASVVGLILLAFLFLGLNGLFGFARRS
jgi:hypothetical protein